MAIDDNIVSEARAMEYAHRLTRALEGIPDDVLQRLGARSRLAEVLVVAHAAVTDSLLHMGLYPPGHKPPGPESG
jgi:hypothetical protein